MLKLSTMKATYRSEHILVIAGKLPSINEYTETQRRNRYCGAGLKSKHQKMIEYCIRGQLKRIKITNPVDMKYTFYEPNKKRDKDNVAGFAMKVVQDALVNVGVLENDGWKNIRNIYLEFKIDKKNPRIEVILREVTDAK